MSRNSHSNRLIRWIVIFGDFFVLNVVILAFYQWHWRMSTWEHGMFEVFILVNNIALIMAQLYFPTIIHMRMVGAGDILKRIVGLTITQVVVAFLLLKVFAYRLPIGWLLLGIGSTFVVLLVLKRLIERWFIKLYREAGRNTRCVTLVGCVPELIKVYEKLMSDPTLGYKVLGYYADHEIGTWTHTMTDGRGDVEDSGIQQPGDRLHLKELERLGSMEEFLAELNEPERLKLGDELFLCVSRRDNDIIQRVSKMCDRQVIRFFYVPVSVESIGLNLKSELLDDMEIYTTYENPLQNPTNIAVKRAFDLLLAMIFMIPTIVIFPFVWIMIKIQSPGPIFFKQKRTGLDGKDFYLYKFRSMHVNMDADKLQATKDDPRKYPFGNFMRKANIDEVPQIFNIIKGDMSVVGPRPHMVAHTEQYSQLIDKYMVRHFVKPGVTGWAQVTGFRGETNELWQMEGRVKRDIWYMEHWSIWLDIRIIWMTLKTFFVHDKHAY